jgi:uncharacterized protein (TIGR02147 family)
MSVSIFEFTEYRVFLNTWLKTQKSGGHGLKSKLAESAGVSSALISQILGGEKNLSTEQALEVCEFVGLTESETEYFLILVESARAGSYKLEQRLKKKRETLQNQAKKISHRVRKDKELTEEEKATFYSSWLYTAVRSLTAVEGTQSVQEIAKHLSIPVTVVSRVVNFLLEHGLCRTENSKLTYGPAFTHLGADSPLVNKHHQNWRIQGMRAMDQRQDDNLFYKAPMSLSKQDMGVVRSEMLKTIDLVGKIVGPSHSEKVCCLNIDWFEV